MMRFARLGGLSPVKYHRIRAATELKYNYPPPRRKGLYAFIWPYLSPFFYMWKVSNIVKRKGLETWDDEGDCRSRAENKYFHLIGYRTFDYEGDVWTHLVADEESSWSKVSTQELQILLAKEKHLLNKDVTEQYHKHWKYPISESLCDDPFKRGRRGMYAKDHLEVFIEKKDVGKIR